MRSRDGEPSLQAHEIGERLRPPDQRDFALQSRAKFRILRLNGARIHDDLRTFEVFRRMSFEDFDPHLRKPLRLRVFGKAHGVPLVAQDFEEELADADFIVDDEDLVRGHGNRLGGGLERQDDAHVG